MDRIKLHVINANKQLHLKAGKQTQLSLLERNQIEQLVRHGEQKQGKKDDSTKPGGFEAEKRPCLRALRARAGKHIHT